MENNQTGERVEAYKCSLCGQFTRFPRYNNRLHLSLNKLIITINNNINNILKLLIFISILKIKIEFIHCINNNNNNNNNNK